VEALLSWSLCLKPPSRSYHKKTDPKVTEPSDISRWWREVWRSASAESKIPLSDPTVWQWYSCQLLCSLVSVGLAAAAVSKEKEKKSIYIALF